MEAIQTDGAQEIGEGQPETRDYEFEARQFGWKPPEEFKGDPSKHVSAKDFVERSESVVPLLQANNKKLMSRLAEMDKKFIKYAKSIDEHERVGYEKAMTDIAAKQREAVEVGDVAAFDALEEQRDKLQKKTEKAEPKTDIDREEKFLAWQVDNPWFGKNDALTQYADLQGRKIMEETGKGMLDDGDLEEVADRVKTRFGDKFPDLFGLKKEEVEEPPARRSAVGGVTANRGKAPRSGADLDQRARQVGESMVRMGIYKDLNEYAKDLNA
jgi:hypothetical protein